MQTAQKRLSDKSYSAESRVEKK